MGGTALVDSGMVKELSQFHELSQNYVCANVVKMCTFFLLYLIATCEKSDVALDHQLQYDILSKEANSVVDPCHFGTDPDLQIRSSDQWIRLWFLIFSSLSSRRQQKNYFKQKFSAYCFLKVHLHHFSKIKKSQNNRKQGFSYYFCLMIEGSGSVPLTNGSGSRRPKNIQIRIDKT